MPTLEELLAERQAALDRVGCVSTEYQAINAVIERMRKPGIAAERMRQYRDRWQCRNALDRHLKSKRARARRDFEKKKAELEALALEEEKRNRPHLY